MLSVHIHNLKGKFQVFLNIFFLDFHGSSSRHWLIRNKNFSSETDPFSSIWGKTNSFSCVTQNALIYVTPQDDVTGVYVTSSVTVPVKENPYVVLYKRLRGPIHDKKESLRIGD